jgi:glycosyltransferase involved in cell wall biosynthesis
MRQPLRALVNASGLDSGGSRTLGIALVEELRRGGDRGVRWEVLVQPPLAEQIGDDQTPGVSLTVRSFRSPARRVLWEQTQLPVIASRADVLVSLGNFGPLILHRKHLLVAHNAVYFAPVAFSGRRGLRLRIERLLGRASVRRAAAVVVPGRSMARLLEDATGCRAFPIPFGPGLVREWRPAPDQRFTFLHRTYWNAHKRLFDLLLAVRELARTDPDRFVVRSACDPFTPFAKLHVESGPDRELLQDPSIARHFEITSFPSEGRTLVGDAVVMPSTVESFCFPLAEAISVGMPVVASDSAYARELCGESAIYAPPGKPGELANAMRKLLRGDRPPPPTAELMDRLSWPHVADDLAALCRRLADRPSAS